MRRLLVPACFLVLAACGPEETHDAPGVTIAQYRAGLAMSAAGGCDTNISSGLNNQLIEELNCIQSNLLVNFSGPNVRTYSSVLPFMEAGAKADLGRATTAKNDFITISSAYRTLSQQYLLYKWWRAGGCGIQVAAVPGSSNHQSGRAIDTPNHTYWRTALGNAGWAWLGSSDVVHFDHLSSPNTASKSTLAFQRLWNKNHSTGRLTEDGVWGPNTANAMASSPTSGFAVHGCVVVTTGVVNGTITEAGTGAALAGATVTAGGQTATTAANGTFSFTLGSGTVTVTAKKTGYVDASVSRGVSLGGTVSASMSLQLVARTGVVQGTVRSGGVAIAGANVTAGGQMTTTTASGAYSLTLPAGAVTVTVSKADFATATAAAAVTAGGTATVNVELVSTAVDQPPVLQIESPASGLTVDAANVSLRGVATDDRGALISFTATLNDGAPVEVTVTGGAFELPVQLVAGDNTLVLRAVDAASQVTSVTWAGSFRAGFSGKVTRFDDEASIVVDAELTLFDTETQAIIGTTHTDLDGTYALVASQSGLARLHVEKEGFTPRDTLVQVSAEERTTLDVLMTPGDTQLIRFIEPASEGPFDQEEITVSGVVNGLEVATVTVNGVGATLIGSGFVVKIPLPEGRTVITAVAESGDGESLSASVVVKRPMSTVRGGCSSTAAIPLLGLLLLGLRGRNRRYLSVP